MDKTARNGKNLLPFDGEVYYFPEVFNRNESATYFDALLQQVSWAHDEVILFGKHHITKRKTAWYGDQDFTYTYSNKSRTALPWTGVLAELKQKVMELTGECFNSCLLNLYHNGDEGMGWHRDNEKTIVSNSAIASVSFGGKRHFYFKHKNTNHRITTLLETGSMLLMKGTTQENWLHSLPKSKKIKEARINLTFRNMLV